jgi:hypothetical protein
MKLVAAAENTDAAKYSAFSYGGNFATPLTRPNIPHRLLL